MRQDQIEHLLGLERGVLLLSQSSWPNFQKGGLPWWMPKEQPISTFFFASDSLFFSIICKYVSVYLVSFVNFLPNQCKDDVWFVVVCMCASHIL
jgi:hypothetical protein